LPGDLQVLFAGSESAGKGDCTYVVMSVISGAIKSTTWYCLNNTTCYTNTPWQRHRIIEAGLFHPVTLLHFQKILFSLVLVVKINCLNILLSKRLFHSY